MPKLLPGYRYIRVCLPVTEKSEDDTKGPHMTDPLPAANNAEDLLHDSPEPRRRNVKMGEGQKFGRKLLAGIYLAQTVIHS